VNAPNSILGGLVADLTVAHHDLLAQRNMGVDLYVDTSDVRRSVLGAYEYTSWPDRQTMQVEVGEFNKSVVLVDCLLAAKFLGPFAMLPPHQAEFLRQIKNDEAFRRIPGFFDQVEFLNRVGIDCAWGVGEAMPGKQVMTNFLHTNAGANTELFFKAIQCIRMPWWDQLSSLRTSGVFMPVKTTFDYPAMLKDPRLPEILKAFQLRRGTVQHQHLVSKNNFADAIALLMLIELARRYTTGEATKVPRFFDSSGIFHEVARDADITAELTLNVDGVKSSVLVSHTYFVYRASLSSGDQHLKLYERLQKTLPAEEQTATELRRLEQAGPGPVPQLHEQLQQFLDLSFLENVWLKTMAFDDISEVVTRWTTEAVRTEDFRLTVDQTIDSTTRDVLRGAAEYRKFSNAWLRLRQHLLEWREGLRGNAILGRPDQETEMGLFRFSPSLRVLGRVRNTLKDLSDDAHDDSEVTDLHVWHELVVCCVAQEGAKYDRTQRTDPLETTEYAIATLWAIKADNHILELFRNRYRDSFFTTVIYAAAMLRLGRDTKRAETVVIELLDELAVAKFPGPHDRAALDFLARHSSVAYLTFHLWQGKRMLPPAWRLADEERNVEHQDDCGFLERAISCVDTAWRCAHMMKRDSSDDRLRERLLYVTNQRLYYLVEQGLPNRLNDIKKTYQSMEVYESSAKAFWRPTYSDTLARYFALRAYFSTTQDAWITFMQSARKYSVAARPAQQGEELIGHFGVYIAEALEAGYRAGNARYESSDQLRTME
jgi:hypothetical protein